VRLSTITAMVSMIPAVVQGLKVNDLERITEIVRRTYPDVPHVGTEVLEGWREGSDSLFLVDVRSREEFDVSHLRSAVNLQSAKEIAEAVKERNASKTILYCSVGFRSARMAHILYGLRVAELMNLEGSIFRWANEDRQIYRGEVPVKAVHPYGRLWAGLLKRGLASAC
jgi:rhodanese-related sulfurtransferase